MPNSMIFCKCGNYTSILYFTYAFKTSCMEHAIHLSAKYFADEIAPSSRAITSKAKQLLQQAELNGKIDLGDFAVNDDSENDEDGDDDFVAGDTLGKAMALVKQVCLCSTCKVLPINISPDSRLSSSSRFLQTVLRASRCTGA